MANTSDKNEQKDIKAAANLDKVAQKLLGFSDDTLVAVANIQKRGERFQDAINRQMDVAKGVSGGSLIDFAQSLRNNASDAKKTKSTNSIFSGNTMELTQQLQASGNELYGYFQDLWQNKYFEIADLQLIAKFIPALGEAVNTMLDAVCATDDLSSVVARQIVFDSTVSSENQSAIEAEINKLELEHKLLPRLKNNVYKPAMISGKYYVYAVSYEDLFSRYSADRDYAMNHAPFAGSPKVPNQTSGYHNSGIRPASESTDIFYDVAAETIVVDLDQNEFKAIITEACDGITDQKVKKQYEKYGEYVAEHVSTVKIIKSSILESALEDIPTLMKLKRSGFAAESVNDPDYKGVYDKFFGATNIEYNDDGGTVDASTITKKGKAEKNWGISGTYIKYIKPKDLVPIKLMGETIGYYNIQTEKKSTKQKQQGSTTSILDPNNGVFNSVSLSESHKNAIIDSIIGSITDEIVKQFGKKFVSKNAQFKKVIADCIQYNGYIDNEYHIQFIPASDIYEFTLDEDDDGNGRSMLSNSLFPAKLLLSLRISKILNYLNQSGNKNIVHITKGPIDVHTGNQVQRVVRNIQETNITFSDLLSTNLVFNKFGRNQNIVIPTARNGNHLAEFETQEGANVDMNPEYEQSLEKDAILGTGVPNVIMEYLGQVDFAKGFETGNIKFANRVATIQGDMEEPTTRLYNKLIQDSSLSDDIKRAADGHFQFRLPRPKTLAIANSTESLNNLQSLLNSVATIQFGENSGDPDSGAIKDIFIRKAAQELATYIDWKAMAKYEADARNEFNKIDQPKDQQTGSMY